MATTWPPGLDDLRRELRRVDGADTTDDQLLTDAVDAAVAFTTRIHRRRYNLDGLSVLLPRPPADITLGTIYLARRLHSRRSSPDGVINLGELGASRIPSFDPDIDRMLKLGRYAGPVIG